MTLTDISAMSDSLVLFSSDDEESDSHYEAKQYENFTSMLKGVPPPSSITISKFTVEEMLQKYKENQASFGFGLGSGTVNLSSSKNAVPFLKYSNSSQISENIASLAQKVQERYIQMETMSSCNIWFNATLESCGSAKKRLRLRQGMGLSPGRRLSHLARRRQFFSSANLQRLASSESIRQIEIKKNTNPGEARKKISRTVESEKLKSSKRALFLSPDNGSPTKYGNSVVIDRKMYSSGSDERKKLPLQERSKKVEVLRWLSQQNFEMDFPRKRPREECANHSVERKRKCPRRSLNFADDDASSNVTTSESNTSADKKTITSGKLSEIHKNKLLWAISVVLRENNITRNNEHFKSLAAKLFFTCRTNLNEILSMNIAEGTSDKILHFARKIIPSVFEELGIVSKSFSESNFKSENNSINGDSRNIDDSKDELKENINKSNVENRNRPSDDSVNEAKFVFKTPKKMGQKRIVRSCQKVPNSGSKKKRNVMRRWRSLELLIEEAVLDSVANTKDFVKVSSEKKSVPVEEGDISRPRETVQSTVLDNEISKYNDCHKAVPNTSFLMSDAIENSNGFSVPTDVIPRLPFVDTSVIFSPIPSSVKEESENILYPSLQHINRSNVQETEVLSDESSISQRTDDSMEVANQDKALEKGIKPIEIDVMLTQDYFMKSRGDGQTIQKEAVPVVEDTLAYENGIPLLVAENLQNDNKETKACQPSAIETGMGSPLAVSKTENDMKGTKESLILTESSFENECGKNENITGKDTEEEKRQNGLGSNGNNEVWEPLTPECISKVEKGTYKPRKLVVKKSKPNWKVVRKNSDEAENESELRLKMRLSHEWEIVCRNSSCSDIGTNSEYETTSMNCSQMSSATDREISSENELEDASRRNSVQSKCDESMDEEITKSNSLSEYNSELQFDGSDQNFNSNLYKNEKDYNCEPTEQKTLLETGSARFSQCVNAIRVNEVNNSLHHDTVGYNTSDTLNVEIGDPNVENRPCLSFLEEAEDGETEDNKFTSEVKSNSFGKNVRHPACNKTDQISQREGRISSLGSDEEINYENSPILLSNRRSGEKSSKKDLEKNVSSSLEAGVKQEDYFPCKRSRELERSQYDSEGGNSSSSSGPERKKKLLSLENYKARKLEEALNNVKLKVSSERNESNAVSSDKVSSGSITTKKIYNIRLKHPTRYHKNKSKHKKYAREVMLKHGSRESDRKKSDFAENVDTGDGSKSALHLRSLHQFLGSFCGKDSPGKTELIEGATGNSQSEHTANISNGNSNEVNIQTIVEALSALSNLVQEQIKKENDKMSSQKESGGNGMKKSNWLDVVSSWCGKNLNCLKLMSNASSLANEGLDDSNTTGMKKILNLSTSQPSDLGNATSKNEHSSSTVKGIVNASDAHNKNSIKTEVNSVQDCVGSISSQRMNLDVNAGYNTMASVNTSMNSSQNIVNSIGQTANYFQIANNQNYSVYSTGHYIGPQISENSCNYSKPLSAFSGVQTASGVFDYKLSGEIIGSINSEYKASFDGQRSIPKALLKDPRTNPDAWSKTQPCTGNSDSHYKGSSGNRECGPLNSGHISVGEVYPAMQAPYQFSNDCVTAQKPSLYQPNMYTSYQMQGDVSSWNYHQNTVSEAYHNSVYYPFQMPNMPYYMNKY